MQISFLTSANVLENSEILNQLKSEYGFSINFNKTKRKLAPSEIIQIAKNSEIIICGTELYDSLTLSSLPKLNILSRVGVGIDNIDLKAAERLGIKVIKSTTEHIYPVAEFAAGIAISLSRNIFEHNASIKNGIWNKKISSSIKGKTLGFIGYGAVAQKITQLLRPFEYSKVNYYDIRRNSNSEDVQMDLDDVFISSDIIFITIPLTKETKNLLQLKTLELAKSNSLIINVSRGGIVNEEASFQLLQKRKDILMFSDVFDIEPYNGRLLQLDNFYGSPHVAGSTLDARYEMELNALIKAIQGLKN